MTVHLDPFLDGEPRRFAAPHRASPTGLRRGSERAPSRSSTAPRRRTCAN